MTCNDNNPLKRSLKQVVFSFFYLLVFPVMLSLLAADWRWTEGWIFSGIFFLFSFSTVVYLYVYDPALLDERFGSLIQKDQKTWDKILLSLFGISFLLWFGIMPLDARRYRWSPEFPVWLKTIGALLLILAFIVLFAALKENTFAAPVVKMQKERGHRVVSTGLYGIVRHPMYLGGTILFISTPLLLGSLWGLVVGLMMSALLAVRSIGEEEMLKQELEGYREYMGKVRWRLLPFVF